MKNIYLLFYLLIAILLNGQQQELLGNNWYLNKLIINGNDYVPPNNSELENIPTNFYEDYMTSTVVNSIEGYAQFIDIPYTDTTIHFDEFTTGIEDCEFEENCNFETGYFYFYIYGGGYPYSYSITEYQDYKELIIINSNSNQAIYRNTILNVEDLLNNKNTNFKLYPNPVKSKLYIENQNNIEDLKIKITNLMGQLLIEDEISMNINEIDITLLKKGLFIITIINSKNEIVRTEKVMKN